MCQNLRPHAIELILNRHCIAVVEAVPLPRQIQAQRDRETEFLGAVENAPVADRPVAHRVGPMTGERAKIVHGLGSSTPNHIGLAAPEQLEVAGLPP